jgi:hypothetical protein
MQRRLMATTVATAMLFAGVTVASPGMAHASARPATALASTGSVVGVAATRTGFVDTTFYGGVQNQDTPFYGSKAGKHLPAPVVGIAADPETNGYWLVTAKGNIFNFNAPFYGSTAGRRLPAPIVGITATATGYVLVTAKGNVYNFNTPFYGSTATRRLPAPIVGITVDPYTRGYWLTTAKGNVYNFGAPFYGSKATATLPAPIVGMSATRTGYVLASAKGNVYNFNTPFYGSAFKDNAHVAGIAVDPNTPGGYWLIDTIGDFFSFGIPSQSAAYLEARASWEEAQTVPSVEVNVYLQRAAAQLNEAITAPGASNTSGYAAAEHALLQLASLPETDDTPAQMAEARNDFSLLNGFFDTHYQA